MSAWPARSTEPKVSAIVPTRDEAENLPLLLPALAEQVDEIVLVDGGSTDRTVEVAVELVPDIVVVHQQGRGKGGAMSAGMKVATGDILVLIDADASMDPAEIPAYVGALRAGADVAKGSRAAAGGGSDDLTALRWGGNLGLRILANTLLGARWTELAYGYFALWKDTAERLDILDLDRKHPDGRMSRGQGFEIECLIFARAEARGMRVVEVASHERRRAHGESNLRTFRDGWRVLDTLLREVAARRRGAAA